MTQQLRMTVWPGSVVPLPDVWVPEFTVREVESGVWFELSADQGEWKSLPVDFYLREPIEAAPDWTMTDNVGNSGYELETVVDFVRNWGTFSDRRDRDIDADERTHIELANSGHIDGWLAEEHRTISAARRVAAVECGMVPAEAYERGRGIAHGVAWWQKVLDAESRLVHPSEVAHRLYLAQAAGTDVRAYLTGKRKEIDSGAIDDINLALTPFSIRIKRDKDPAPSAYSVMALQIVNDLVERASTRECANEKCGRIFTRQRGRAQYGEYRSKGVMYCSKSCALAQTQRDRRRRIKQDLAAQDG